MIIDGADLSMTEFNTDVADASADCVDTPNDDSKASSAMAARRSRKESQRRD